MPAEKYHLPIRYVNTISIIKSIFSTFKLIIYGYVLGFVEYQLLYYFKVIKADYYGVFLFSSTWPNEAIRVKSINLKMVFVLIVR